MSQDIEDSKKERDWHMPARPRVPDPEAGPLQAFAYDLRQLGVGKASIPYIADMSQRAVSRAALYAALSGARLPSEKTVARLLMWWTGEGALDDQHPEDFEDPRWWWLHRLEPDHEGWAWQERYFEVVAAAETAVPRTAAAPVSIDVPEEQRRLAQALVELAEEAGIEQTGWLLSGPTYRQLKIYFTGRRIPGDAILWNFVEVCAERSNVERLRDRLATYERLKRLAAEARAARVRDRRVERNRLAGGPEDQ